MATHKNDTFARELKMFCRLCHFRLKTTPYSRILVPNLMNLISVNNAQKGKTNSRFQQDFNESETYGQC